MQIGYFGASTGAAAAIVAFESPSPAVVCIRWYAGAAGPIWQIWEFVSNTRDKIEEWIKQQI